MDLKCYLDMKTISTTNQISNKWDNFRYKINTASSVAWKEELSLEGQCFFIVHHYRKCTWFVNHSTCKEPKSFLVYFLSIIPTGQCVLNKLELHQRQNMRSFSVGDRLWPTSQDHITTYPPCLVIEHTLKWWKTISSISVFPLCRMKK